MTPRRVVVAFPQVASATAWSRILAVRDRYDPLAPRVAPHLTVVFPFEDPLADAALERWLRASLAGVPRFSVVLAEITAHEGEYLFLNVKRGNDPLVALHDRLYAGPLAAHRRRTFTFVPHLTVGRVAAADLPAALDATADLTSPIPATIDRLAVYRIEPDGARPVLFDVPLAD